MSQVAVKKYLGPLQAFIEQRTLGYRNTIANTRYQAIMLTTPILTGANVPKHKHAEFRKMAYAWAQKNSHSELNSGGNQMPGKQFIILNDYNQAGSFFRAAKQQGYLGKDNKIHRGHITAVVKEAAATTLDDTADELRIAGAPKFVVDRLKTLVNRRIQAVQPTIVAKDTKHISDNFYGGVLEVSILMPELAKSNLSKKEERELKGYVDSAIAQFLKEHGDDLIGVEGSKSMIKATSDYLDEAIIGKKKPKAYKKKNAQVIKARKAKQKARAPGVATIPRLRDIKGRFASAVNIQQIIQSQITEKVKENMGEGGSLVNRTGRFAESVALTNITQSRQGTLTAFYNYMKYPYQTFERGFKQGSTRRDPRLLISRSIREIAVTLISRKLNIKTRRV
jgi:hypothetical protein